MNSSVAAFLATTSPMRFNRSQALFYTRVFRRQRLFMTFKDVVTTRHAMSREETLAQCQLLLNTPEDAFGSSSVEHIHNPLLWATCSVDPLRCGVPTQPSWPSCAHLARHVLSFFRSLSVSICVHLLPSPLLFSSDPLSPLFVLPRVLSSSPSVCRCVPLFSRACCLVSSFRFFPSVVFSSFHVCPTMFAFGRLQASSYRLLFGDAVGTSIRKYQNPSSITMTSCSGVQLQRLIGCMIRSRT